MSKGKVIKFNLNSESLRIKEILRNRDFIKVEIWAISDQYPNNNASHFPLATMEENIKEKNFYDKPVLGKFNTLRGDYEEHNSETKYDPELNSEYEEYEDGETPMGFIRNTDEVRIVEEDGEHWIVFTAVLWVKYNYQKIKKLLKDKRKKVSVEVTVYESHIDEHGIEVFDKWSFDGVTILGNIPNTNIPIKEGIEGAHLTILEKMDSLFSAKVKKLQFAYRDLDLSLNESHDINEPQRSLYNNVEKEDKKLFTVEQKQEILENSLKKAFIQSEEDVFVMGEITEDTVHFSINGVEKLCNFIIDEENQSLQLKYDCDEDRDNPNDGHDDHDKNEPEDHDVDDNEEHIDDACDKQAEACGEQTSEACGDKEQDECGSFIEEKCEESPSKTEQKCEKDTQKEEEKCDNHSEEECNFVVINDVKYDVFSLEEKYQADMSSKNEQYENLHTQFTALQTKYNDLLEELTSMKRNAFATEMEAIAHTYNLKKEAIQKIVTDCKAGLFSDKEACMKEIAYQKLIMKNENEVSKEFSAPVYSSIKEDEQNMSTDVFSQLSNYIKK